MSVEKAIETIEAQQKELNKYSPAFCVGEQLKEIISKSPAAAELVLQDLTQVGMGLKDCEKKISAFASGHRSGGCGCCPPDEAEKIICQFYGISTQQTAPAIQGTKVLNLSEFL
jgi:hypothetical protein